MSKRIYLDTNVYLDYLEDRVDTIRPLGEFTAQVFKRTLECEFEIAYSDWVLRELKVSENLSSVLLDLIKDLKKLNKFVIISASDADIVGAKNNSKNWKDYLHVLLAIKVGAELIVTRNIKDFDEFSNLLEAKLPEDI
ncbi:MAG: hypothetical protein Q7K42_02080 [Candidatus Diapherotrites archaeon]|nr:hypothetical protein [Candidatus Diapherotrites archaeon]